MSKGNKAVYIRCPYCAKQSVRINKRHIVRHLTRLKVVCKGTGELWTNS